MAQGCKGKWKSAREGDNDFIVPKKFRANETSTKPPFIKRTFPHPFLLQHKTQNVYKLVQ